MKQQNKVLYTHKKNGKDNNMKNGAGRKIVGHGECEWCLVIIVINSYTWNDS